MKYFKNTELAKLYNVSEKSVRNWIDATKLGKLDLALYQEREKHYIANTATNTHRVEQLVRKGQKFKNTRGFKSITPNEEFYQHFSVEEIFDLISNVDIHREIPHKFCYFAEGAQAWDSYVKKMVDQPFPNSLKDTVELLNKSIDYLDTLFEGYTRINVIDIGPGNSHPVRVLLEHLLREKLLGRYIALDASSDMIDIAEKNIAEWFGGRVAFERHIVDANYDRFDDLLVGDTFSEDDERVLNLVLFLGGTISNLRDADLALRTIANSMGKDDVFVLSRKLDTPESRRFFDFNSAPKDGKLVDQEKAIIDMLGIDESSYDLEQLFDTENMRRVLRIRLKVDLSITFRLEKKRRVVQLRKNEAILVWHADHNSLIGTAKQFDANGLDILQLAKSKDQQYLQVISKIKTDQ